jgi:SAM-dependent methyltransferase
MHIVGDETYDAQSKEYAGFADKSFSWLYMERPALDEALAGYYGDRPDIHVLDVGCGHGRVIKHLIERGIPADKITGLDPSVSMLDIAARDLPQEVSLVGGKAADMPFRNESFHLVVANMVLHAMNSREAAATVKRIGEVLVPGGEFFLIDTHPRSDSPQNSWATRRSPWGRTLDVFNHDLDTLLGDVASSYGLERVRSGSLAIDKAGRSADPDEFARYSTGQFRIAALLRKAD